jgi:hypothetical protein
MSTLFQFFFTSEAAIAPFQQPPRARLMTTRRLT